MFSALVLCLVQSAADLGAGAVYAGRARGIVANIILAVVQLQVNHVFNNVQQCCSVVAVIVVVQDQISTIVFLVVHMVLL